MRRSEIPEKYLALGALPPSLFWISQDASFFPEKVPEVKDVWLNERFASALMLALISLGYLAERGRRGSRPGPPRGSGARPRA